MTPRLGSLDDQGVKNEFDANEALGAVTPIWARPVAMSVEKRSKCNAVTRSILSALLRVILGT